MSRLKFILDIASLEAGSLKMNTALEYDQATKLILLDSHLQEVEATLPHLVFQKDI